MYLPRSTPSMSVTATLTFRAPAWRSSSRSGAVGRAVTGDLLIQHKRRVLDCAPLRPRGHMARLLRPLLALALALAATAVAQVPEYEAKSEFLERFTRFI